MKPYARLLNGVLERTAMRYEASQAGMQNAIQLDECHEASGYLWYHDMFRYEQKPFLTEVHRLSDLLSGEYHFISSARSSSSFCPLSFLFLLCFFFPGSGGAERSRRASSASLELLGAL